MAWDLGSQLKSSGRRKNKLHLKVGEVISKVVEIHSSYSVMQYIIDQPFLCYTLVRASQDITIHAKLLMLSKPYYNLQSDYLDWKLTQDLGSTKHEGGQVIRLVGGMLHSLQDEPSVASSTYRVWYKYGLRHREGDKPARVYSDGSKHWFLRGKPAREGDKSMVEYRDGTQVWCLSDTAAATKIHRDGDKPAVICRNGYLAWYKEGKRHREGDKPATVRGDGYKEWILHGLTHRDGDLPAKVHSGSTKEWWKYGQRHRGRGKPAIERADGTKEWWEHGKSGEGDVEQGTEQVDIPNHR